MAKLNIILFVLAIATAIIIQSSDAVLPRNVDSIRFLVTVNDTWGQEIFILKSCIATVATPLLRPGVKHNFTEAIHVADCDHGPLDFRVVSSNDGKSQMTVDLVFHSSVIEDASPPTCSIPWNGSYLVPSPKKMDMSLLPGCMTGDSREGYHMTYYWFYLLDWTFG